MQRSIYILEHVKFSNIHNFTSYTSLCIIWRIAQNYHNKYQTFLKRKRILVADLSFITCICLISYSQAALFWVTLIVYTWRRFLGSSGEIETEVGPIKKLIYIFNKADRSPRNFACNSSKTVSRRRYMSYIGGCYPLISMLLIITCL